MLIPKGKTCIGMRKLFAYYRQLSRDVGLLGARRSSANMKLFEPNVETKKATFAMACFWSPDSQFGCFPGVIRTRVGFTGGMQPDPTYRNLGDHTEATQIDYDPTVTTYEKLLVQFWKGHDPAAKNKTQYKSAIYYHDEEQQHLAESQLKEIASKSNRPIQTEVLKATTFYDAELYHHKYYLQTYHPTLVASLGLKGKDFITSHVAARLNGYIGKFGTLADFENEWPKLGLDEEQAAYVRKQIIEGAGATCH